ncbi:MAG TPA: adenylate/guanylate cyclase domain-containing protein, partial [Acidimicrobiia bacterium]|nr:adenylate/guanylate cyclase domain-containing protein [Acidimicrobiia bacterium]
MTELPTGTVTFLFTDLEGSSRLWVEFPEAMQTALARHDDILRDAITTHDGHVVKMTGDGVHAVFASAADAVCAARDAQLALGSEAWEGTARLRVRMGIHTGPAQCRDGDYFGTAVNRAARLMSVAHGGQVLVSLTTEELLRDETAEGWSLADIGEHRLRDLARAEHVFQLCAVGLADEFPPLRTLDRLAGNLPTQLTSFVGRDEELKSVADALGSSRLVTLTGVGGVGKTRFALQVAAEVLPRYGDGAWLVELASANDSESMLELVAATLGVSPRVGMSLAGSIVDFLRTKQLLIVLDNCEHLLEASATLTESVLRDCRGIDVLATSREGLAVEGEQLWPLRSLPLPDASRVDVIAASAAVRLFEERAQAVSPSFVVEASNAGAVAEVCRRLDGVPLAIELAAARANVMTPNEIAGLLDERFRLLTGARRTAVGRHQTLQATVDWSYSLLEERERQVFDRLGVFSGSFDADAAAVVAASDDVDVWTVRDTLGRLVGRSMVTADQRVEGTRHAMLETLRQYARERLDERGEGDRWRRRHAEHYAGLAEEIGAHRWGPEELIWTQRLRADLDNIRAAVFWALDSEVREDHRFSLSVVADLADEVQWDRTAGVGGWAEQALPIVGEATTAQRPALLGAAAFHAYERGDVETARDLAIDAVRDGVPVDCPSPQIPFLALSAAEATAGRLTEADAVLTEALDHSDAIQRNPHARAVLMAVRALFRSFGGNEVARADADTALRVARQLGAPTLIVVALTATGYAWLGENPARAREAFEESIALTESGASDVNFSLALRELARLRMRDGDPAGALDAL